MALLLPADHPAREWSAPAPAGQRPVRVGVVNIMPRLQAYEPLLLRRLDAVGQPVEPVFLRLRTHVYRSSDPGHLARFYAHYDEVAPLDGVIVTGAPVEELPFESVRYIEELSGLIERGQQETRGVLGLCWGGLAVGRLLGIPKRRFTEKLFGVFEEEVLPSAAPLSPGPRGARFACAQSRHSGGDEEALQVAAREGKVLLLSRSHHFGTGIYASPDCRLVAHLGHPEYEAERLVFEYERDRRVGRADVGQPAGLDLASPATTWRSDSERFFSDWVGFIAPRAPLR